MNEEKMVYFPPVEEDIETSLYFKYRDNKDKRWHYGMISTSGHVFSIDNWYGVATVNLDFIDAYVSRAEDEIKRLKENYELFEDITMEEFVAQFNEAQAKLNRIIQRETKY